MPRIEKGLSKLAKHRRHSVQEAPRTGSAAALLKASEQASRVIQSGDVEELERLIAEGCERPGEAASDLA